MTLPDAAQPLSPEQATTAFDALLDGAVGDDAARDFILTMSLRGETAIEIAAAVRAIRARMIRVAAPDGAIDVCGTGGDMSNSLNVSTAVAIVVAACDVPVAKHGNRAASSQAGGADTLEALGLDLDRASETAEATLAEFGIAFLFAQKHHPALARLAPIRRSIQRRTIFNLTGPACNPAGVRRQLIGIARPDYLPIYADALAMLGTEDAILVAGDEPLDELSIGGPSTVIRLGHPPERITPADAGLPTHPLTAIRGGDAAYNAQALRRLLMGENGAYRDAVLFNSAAALIVARHARDWQDGVEEAAEAVDKGLAKALLDCWIAYCA
ncbi:Anthranilate phosphoribosyltransferase [Sphingomonas antarctica]|uniref:anthranilate phosphoribosyltransferase n=1 Tax=Sphingomonas antarctica TaxID=2040274 RepID=UPI0039EC926E